VKILKTVSLEEKLNAQVKNIVAILKSENPLDVRLMMFEMQKEYLEAYLQNIADELKEQLNN
jgi:hypothetical protein